MKTNYPITPTSGTDRKHWMFHEVIRNFGIYPLGNWVDKIYSKKRNKALYLLGWVIG